MSDRGHDTILAVATGHGRHAISIIRISGPRAALAFDGDPPRPRYATVRTLRDPGTGSVVDHALALWFPGPATATGEDVAEWHVHGGPAVRAAALSALLTRPGFRVAEPGEFTRRAFLNGRLDLAAVEGLADLVDAETEAQRRQALRQFEGVLGRRVQEWRTRLIHLLAALDAGLDFSDEGDVPPDVSAGLALDLSMLAAEIRREIADARRGERLRDGYMVVLAGPPNAGKSTLLNALARRDVAIVSPVPGTTRDALEVRCDLDGLPVVFVDTAGLRASDDTVERIGMERTRSRARDADLVLWLSAFGGTPPPEGLSPAASVHVATKRDLGPIAPGPAHAVSAATGLGIEALLGEVARRASLSLPGGGDALVTRERHRAALTSLVEALGRAETRLGEGYEELAAEDVRLGLRALGRVTGEVDVEDVLDQIFARFCIGK